MEERSSTTSSDDEEEFDSLLEQKDNPDVQEDVSTTTTKTIKTTNKSILWQRKLRINYIEPILPPPIIRGIHEVDLLLEPYVGTSEATISISITLLFAYIILLFISLFRNTGSSKGKAIQDDDTDIHLQTTLESSQYDTTVLLLGPKNSGKTRIFYRLCYNQIRVPTLSSLKPNVGIYEHNNNNNTENTTTTTTITKNIRYIDWPGCLPIIDHNANNNDNIISKTILSNNNKDVRIVVVVDSTQSVAAAADTLYQIFTLLYNNYNNKKNKNNNTKLPVIFIACNKSDFPKSKNSKRIQIQLRTELERLLTVRKAEIEDNNNKSSLLWWPVGEPLELDQLNFISKLYFTTTSCDEHNNNGIYELKEYCINGNIIPS